MTQSPNRLLAALPANEFAAVKAHLKPIELPFETVVAEAGSSIKHVYFPHSGVISLVVELKVGEMIETAMVGRDGVVNAAAALDGKISLNKGIVQAAGTASIMAVEPCSQTRRSEQIVPRAAHTSRAGAVCTVAAVGSLQRQSLGREPHVPMAAVDARPWRQRRSDADAGVSRADAGGPAAERIDRGQHAAKGRVDQIPARPHPPAGHQGAPGGRLRVLQHRQSPLWTVVFALEIICKKGSSVRNLT